MSLKFLYNKFNSILLVGLSANNGPSSRNRDCIVIVDDEIDLLVVYKKALELTGLKVSAFSDPIKALEEFKLNYTRYVLVITDIRMQQMSGYELINQIKKINPEIKVIFVTAQDVSKSDIISKLDKGIFVDEFMHKPVSLDRLNRLVLNIIDNHP